MNTYSLVEGRLGSGAFSLVVHCLLPEQWEHLAPVPSILWRSLRFLSDRLNWYALYQDLRKLTFKPPSVGANGIRPPYM
ncbi:MAG: hypothetical protein F6K17_31960 [Okeania sp. SIO3C4]|nr:hypothetical protein [Okeania sp. SIO3B3]NER06870.1 hypothetical protein [Okeania sp. SIO3C4]